MGTADGTVGVAAVVVKPTRESPESVQAKKREHGTYDSEEKNEGNSRKDRSPAKSRLQTIFEGVVDRKNHTKNRSSYKNSRHPVRLVPTRDLRTFLL